MIWENSIRTMVVARSFTNPIDFAIHKKDVVLTLSLFCCVLKTMLNLFKTLLSENLYYIELWKCLWFFEKLISSKAIYIVNGIMVHMDTVHCNSYNVCERRPVLRVKCPAFFHYCAMTVNKEIIIIYIGLFYLKILKEFVFYILTFLGKILAHSFYTRFLLILERLLHQSLHVGSVL